MSGSHDEAGRSSPRPRSGPGSPVPHGGTRRRYSRGGMIAAWVSVVVVAALVIGSLAAYLKYRAV